MKAFQPRKKKAAIFQDQEDYSKDSCEPKTAGTLIYETFEKGKQLHRMIRFRDEKAIELIKNLPMDIRNWRGEKGRTALMIAVDEIFADEDIVKALLDGATLKNITMEDSDGDTALTIACSHGNSNLGVIRILLNRLPPLISLKKDNPLLQICNSDNPDIQVLQLLLEYTHGGLMGDFTNGSGNTPIMIHLQRYEPNLNAMKFILKEYTPEDLYTQNKRFETALDILSKYSERYDIFTHLVFLNNKWKGLKDMIKNPRPVEMSELVAEMWSNVVSSLLWSCEGSNVDETGERFWSVDIVCRDCVIWMEDASSIQNVGVDDVVLVGDEDEF
eukprot:TRINITY_DN775865_c0_g1_i1.p1 TRINITY_DN775865_c0_g1~~TRINITY_DN775865_c0_g1_i1.p1  ORF type:complete len:330 (+),score=81.47 TRINITY_DN775865_c0_g1_i1:95-1084(+)